MLCLLFRCYFIQLADYFFLTCFNQDFDFNFVLNIFMRIQIYIRNYTANPLNFIVLLT